ncbi:MAG: cytosine permease [Chloroflexi bacterium]|nr:cytosine permease [Chloroflexota bacterium]
MSAETASPAAVENEFLKVETTGIEAIPDSGRHGRPGELGGMWAGAFTNYASLLTGSLLLSLGLGMLDSLLAIVVGAVLAALVLGLVSVSGPRSGVPQIVFSRRVFGYRGAYLPGALTLFLAVGWFAVDCVIATDALSQLLGILGAGSSKTLNAILLLLVVALSVLVAIYGHRTVVVFERFGAAVFLAFCVVLFALLAPRIHWQLGATVHGSAHLGAWVLGASYIFALVASWFSFAADYSRYLPRDASPGAVAGWVTAGTAIPTVALGMLGVLLLSIDTRTDLLTTIVNHAPRPLAVGFLLFVALGMIWANYFDVYTAGLVTLALDIRMKRWQTALLAGIVGGLLAYYALFVSSFLAAYQNFLSVTYIWAPAWAAIMLLDLFVLGGDGASAARRIHGDEAESYFRRTGIRWPALVGVLAGTAAAIPFVNSTLWSSPLAVHVLQQADLSGLVSFLVGGLVFTLLRRARPAAAGR